MLALLATFVPGSGFFSLEGQVITAIPATLFLWIVATAIALLRSHRYTTALRQHFEQRAVSVGIH